MALTKSKQLYTGPITDLVSVNTASRTVTINRDFDVEYILNHDTAENIVVTRTTVYRSTIIASNSNYRVILGQTPVMTTGSTGGITLIISYFSVRISNGEITFKIFNGGSNAQQLTTDNIAPSDKIGYFYKLYV